MDLLIQDISQGIAEPLQEHVRGLVIGDERKSAVSKVDEMNAAEAARRPPAFVEKPPRPTKPP